jgi:hypothetical protein
VKSDVAFVSGSTFPTFFLMVCREEAEGLFASWDTSSEAATPRASETGQSPALTPTLHHSRLGSLSPGALDDSNFPSLGLPQSAKVCVTSATSADLGRSDGKVSPACVAGTPAALEACIGVCAFS